MDRFLERAQSYGDNVDWTLLNRTLYLYSNRPRTAKACLALAEQESLLVEQMAEHLPCPGLGPGPYICDVEQRWNLFVDMDDILFRHGFQKGFNATMLAVFLVAPLSGLHSYVQTLTDMSSISRADNRRAMVHCAIFAFLSKGMSLELIPQSAVLDPVLASPDRSRYAPQNARMRDKNRCVLSGLSDPEAARIVRLSGSTWENNTWLDLIVEYWGKEKCARWLALIKDPDIFESAQNLLCLNKQLHAWWAQARFALKPVSRTDRSVTVQFHWTRRPTYTPRDLVPRNIDDALGQHRLGGTGIGVDSMSWGHELAHQACGLPIRTGQLFTIESSEGAEMLPDWELLELQWDVLRVAAMSGAGEMPDDYCETAKECAEMRAP